MRTQVYAALIATVAAKTVQTKAEEVKANNTACLAAKSSANQAKCSWAKDSCQSKVGMGKANCEAAYPLAKGAKWDSATALCAYGANGVKNVDFNIVDKKFKAGPLSTVD